jgi:hypothetical protein
MNIETIVQQLQVERRRIDAALNALIGEQAAPARAPATATAPATTSTTTAAPKSHHKRKARSLTPEAKAKISTAQKARWALIKANSKPAVRAA